MLAIDLDVGNVILEDGWNIDLKHQYVSTTISDVVIMCPYSSCILESASRYGGLVLLEASRKRRNADLWEGTLREDSVKAVSQTSTEL